MEQLVFFALDQRRVQLGICKGRAAHHLAQKRHVVGHADNVQFTQGLVQTGQGLLAGVAMHDQLGDHGVVVRTDLVTLSHTTVPAHLSLREALRQGYAHDLQAAGGGQKVVVRGFCANPRFDGMALHPHLLLRQGQRLACGDAQLPLDQVQAGDRFGDRVFHL